MINPIVIDEVPKTAQAIFDRINTLSFNSSLMREMRAINFVTKLVDSGFDDGGRLKRMFIHCVDAEEEMRKLGASSKLNAQWDFLHVPPPARPRSARGRSSRRTTTSSAASRRPTLPARFL